MRALVESYAQSVFDLLLRHRQGLPRLTSPAERAARALIEGGSFYLAGSESGWKAEGIERSGGLIGARALPSATVARPGDVIWLSFTPSTYGEAVRAGRQLEERACPVLAFGPKPGDGPPEFTNWIDSLTPWGADPNFTRLGNVLTLWSLTAEIASATARQNKTLAFWQNLWVPEGDVRDQLYKKCMFHDGVPQMEPVEALFLARSYLNYIEGMYRRIQKGELEKIVKTGEEMARRAMEFLPTAFIALSHLMPQIVDRDGKLFEYFDEGTDPAILERFLGRDGLLICLWHNGVPPHFWRAVRRAGARAIWVVCPLPDQVDFEQFGDVFVDQHWALGDCAVQVPGYDVRILPPSGLAQLFIYELLKAAAA